jgi:hypothetical protein
MPGWAAAIKDVMAAGQADHMAGRPLAATPMAAMTFCSDSAKAGSEASAVIWSCQRST